MKMENGNRRWTMEKWTMYNGDWIVENEQQTMDNGLHKMNNR